MPSELEPFDEVEVIAILANLRALYCRRRIDYMDDVSAVIDGENGPRHKAALANIAFADEPETLGNFLNAVSIKR